MRVINDGNFCLICGATTDGFDCELGIYSSEKKALRVLDEIERYARCVACCDNEIEMYESFIESLEYAKTGERK